MQFWSLFLFSDFYSLLSADYYLYSHHLDTLNVWNNSVPNNIHASSHLCLIVGDGGGPEKARADVPGGSVVVVNSSGKPNPYDVIDVHNRGDPLQALQSPEDSPCNSLEAGWSAGPSKHTGIFKADIDPPEILTTTSPSPGTYVRVFSGPPPSPASKQRMS